MNYTFLNVSASPYRNDTIEVKKNTSSKELSTIPIASGQEMRLVVWLVDEFGEVVRSDNTSMI